MKKLVLSIITFLDINPLKYTCRSICFLIFFLMIQKTEAQCPQEDIELTSQQEVNDFASTYPGCTELLGHLIIDGDYNYSINNLNSLTGITHIAGDLEINANFDLEILTGLDSITDIGGNLWISYNAHLMTLTGLDNVNSVGGYLYIQNNGLTTLTALQNLDTIGLGLHIGANYSLKYLTGLENISSVGHSLHITGNDELRTLGALRNINAVGLNLDIWSNDELTDLTGLENISSIGGRLVVSNNPKLVSLAGLDNIANIGGNLSVRNNDRLVNLMGLENLDTLTGNLAIENNYKLTTLGGLGNSINIAGEVVIQNNSILSLCSVPSICTYLQNGGAATIYNNDPGCHSQAQIQAGCMSAPVCLFTDIYFANQQQIDSFSVYYPQCTDISGDVRIGSSSSTIPTSINNLNGLNQLISIGGDLRIVHNEVLSELTGLDNLNNITGELVIIDNANLTDLSSLENLISIGNLLHIAYNTSLSSCNLTPFCEYLENGGANIIGINAPGCDSQTEVEDACIIIPFPVEIASPLQVYLNNETAILKWKTATETNNEDFEVQRSKDGVQWQRIGWQAGQGNSLIPHAYTHIDENPLFGTSYYRFKQTDFNGDFAYSNIVTLQYIRPGVTIFPNPNTGIFDVQTTVQGTYKILNTSGQIIQTGDMKNNLSIDISQEAQGVYFISIQMDNEVITKRMIKL